MEFIKVEKKQPAESESLKEESTIQWQPFPIELLPGTMRDIAIGVQNTVGLKDSSTPAIATLATVSGLIGASCKIRIKQGYFQPAHLFTAIVQKSGQSKSGTKEYLIDPLQDIQGEWHDEWERDTETYQRDMAEWKSAKKGERPECPAEPEPPKRIIVSDITIEAVGQRLKENPFGLLLYNDELDSYFGSMGRYSNGNDLPHWLSIHNGKPLTIDRKRGDYIRIANPAVAIIGGVQPYILKDRLKDNPDYFHSGFLARFLLAMPPTNAVYLNDNVIPQAASSGWEWFLKNILQQRESAMIDGKLTPHVFPIDKSAWDTLIPYQRRHADLATSENDSESALEGKFLTNTARIALILHVVNLIESGANLSDCLPIPGDTMESACKIAEWFVDESKRIYVLLAEGTEKSILSPDQQIVMKVLEKHQPATERDIKRHCAEIDKKWEAGKLEKILREMVGQKLIERLLEGKAEKYRILSADTTDTDTSSLKHGKYGGSVSVSAVSTPKNTFSTLPEFDQFADN